MAKQLNVSLAFTADTTQAKRSLQDLQSQLNLLIKNTTTTSGGLGLTQDLMKATTSAMELKNILSSATSPTGLLDLGVFNQQLALSSKKLSDYANDLNSLGPSGQQAFANIAKAIVTAEMPLKRTSSLLKEFGTTLANTARWQISSSVLHGFMGAIQSAYGYAQNLNRSLNDIRIVTGQSADQMAEFAEKANKAAQSLSATTTEYTNASLIYYQQGLSDSEVEERTAITIKMANAAGENAEKVSDQLTAVWNNFYDGTKSLEYYADVMTALGAATASSTDEIAGGLEKFAAIGETIGLSYEYAASALATITSNTRQSEEVVGTALKTIFARIQGLNLGETLDDGTTLNKYSEALQKVGISIFDSTGELKAMDSILDEMADKWITLSKDQQAALAQTVAGVRQYTQLVALMENWDNGDNDSMTANLETAYGSTGALQEQADIYAESWEAAQDRVTAAAENIYQTLLDDKFFIGLTNAFAGLLKTIGGVVDGLGGLPGTLSLIGGLVFKEFSPEISKSIENLFYNLTFNTESAKEELFKLRQEAVAAMKSLGDDSIAGSASVDIFVKQSELQDQLLLKSKELEQSGKSLTEEETRRAQILMDSVDHLGQQVLKAAELRQEQELITSTIINRLNQESMGKVDNLEVKIAKVKDLQTIYTTLSPIINQCKKEIIALETSGTEKEKARGIKSISTALTEMKKALIDTGVNFDELDKETQDAINKLLKINGITFEEFKNELIHLGDQVDAVGQDAQKAFNDLKKALLSVEGIDSSAVKKILDELKTSLSTTGKFTAEQITLFKNFGIAVDESGRIINGFKGNTISFADGITALGSSLMSLSTTINSIIGLTRIWTDESLSTGEKMLQTLTTVAMLLPAITSLLNKENLVKLKRLVLDKQTVKTNIIKIAGLKAEEVAEKGLTKAIWAKIAAQIAANWYYAAAIAIILAIVAVVATLINSYNEEAHAAERAAEKATSLKETYNETQQAAKDLKATISDYTDAVDAMSKLEEGTLEYKQALLEANEQAIELLSKYKILNQYTTRSDNGQIIITQEGLDAVLEEQLRTVAAVQAQWIDAEIAASQAQEDLDLVNFSREYKVTGEENWEQTSKQIVESIANYLKKNDLNELIEDDLEKLSGWGDLSEEVQAHIKDNIGAYSEMGVSLNNANVAQDILTQSYLDAAWKLNHPEGDNNNSNPADNIGTIVEEALYNTYVSKAVSDDAIAEWKNNYVDEQVMAVFEDEGWTDLGKAMVAGDVAMARGMYGERATGDDAQEYADLMGYTFEIANEGFAKNVKYMWNAIQFWDDEIPTTSWQFYDKNGTAVGGPINNVDLLDDLATEKATRVEAERADVAVPEVLAKLNTVVNSLGELGTSTFANLLASGAVITNKDGSTNPQFQLASAGMSQEEALYIQKNWDQVTAAFSGAAENIGFWTEMGFQSYEEYLQYAKDWIDERAEQSDAEAIGLETLTKIQQRGANVENAVLSGDLTSENAKENTDYIEMVKGANLLTQVYPELIEEAKVLSNTNLVGTEMWISALHKVQEKADELKLDGLIAQSEKIEEEISEMFEGLDGKQTEIEAVLLSDEFETKLDELLDKSYEIDIEIHAQAEQAFESFSAATSTMQAMASKIGEGYVVAAEDIRELNAVFPGIIQGMEAVGDGSVRLNSQVVQNAMNSANAEIQASGLSTVEQLENQAKILRSKQASYMAMYEAALALSKGEGDAATHTATLQEELANIQALNDKESSETEMENAEAVATDSNIQAGITAENWNSAYASAAKSAIEFAKTAVSAQQAAQSGEATYQMGDFGVTYQGRNGQSSEGAKLAELQSAVDSATTEDDYAALAQQFLEAAESAGSRANDIEGMIAEIGASTIDLTHLMEQIGNGEGSDGDKDKDKEEKLEKVEELNKNDLIERYKETEEAIDDVRDSYDEASKAADRLYGAGRIAAMAKANAQLLKEVGLLKEKKKEAQEYLKIDRAAVDIAAADAGVTLEYDANGNIVNYTHELSHLADEYNELVRSINAAGGATKEEKEMLEEKKKKITTLTEAVNRYKETQETIESTDDEIQDRLYEWQDNNFEMWSHSLEVTLDITEDAAQVLDILLSRTEGKFFKQAEGLALMGAQLALTNVEMGSYIGHLGMLGGLMATGSISPADFVEGLGQVKEGAFNAAQAIYELDQQMIEYYGNALELAREEIDKITNQMEHGTSVLEHYLSLLDLMGHETDYKNRGIVLEGRAQTLRNELEALDAESKMWAEEAEKKKKMYDNVLLPTTAEVYKQQYEDALNASMETQEEFLSKAEEYAEALNEILENSLNQYNQELENALTGGRSFESMTTEMERMVSLQEEYLTTTNKIYETEKLMNKAQQEIDKSTNTVAKQKLKQFIAETDQLKEKNKLSKFELDVQQAKYELLLAEIALEEAQNAKSQVRLQRDKEGNFGYVYTADSSAVNDAQQELADKQNEFYNITLEGINTYAEKYTQTLQEMYDTLTEIDQKYHEGAYESEAEYLAEREAAISYYYDKLGQYSELYNIAIQLDADATADAWGTDYKDMVNSTDQWKVAVSAHAANVTAAFNEWGNEMDRLADLTSTRMDQLADSVKKVTDESDSLLHELVDDGGLLEQVEREMTLVSILTGIYAALRVAVLGAAAAYMALGTAMMFAQTAASVGSMISSIDFGGIADTVGSAIGNKTSNSETKTNTTSSGNSNKSSGYSVGDTIHINKGDAVYDYVGGSQEKARYSGDYTLLKDLGNGWYSYGSGGAETGKIKLFDTGGYTGEWGSYGKLAMLHEKELVLNANDTENFLASMDLLDNIVSTIDLHAANQSFGGTLNSPGLGAIGSETLEQTVTIEANFPGVSSRTEIEEAFSTLVNRASQYANRK